MITAYLYVTLRCNARCRFCKIWKEQADAPPDMPYELGVSLLDDLRRMGVRHVDFTGGEPTLYEPLPDLVRYARQIGLLASITTNGLMYPSRADELSNMFLLIGLSLNGPDAKMHNAAQGINSFDEVLESAKIASDLNEPIHFHFTASDSSIFHLETTRELANSLGLHMVVFPEFSYFGNRGLSDVNLLKLLELSREPGLCINTASVVFQLEGGNDIRSPRCNAGKSAIAISPMGELLLPCFHRAQHVIPTNGRLYETYMQTNVRAIINNSGRYEFCEGCTNWCYINPSFLTRPDKYAYLHTRSAIINLKATYGSRWVGKALEVVTRGRI